MGAPWWTYPRIDNFGQIDPAGPFYKPDSNVQVPGNYPIIAPAPGTVTDVKVTGFGQTVVTVQFDKPINAAATHYYMEHMSDAAVNPGQHVNVGDLIGHNNPDGQVPLGFGFFSGSSFGSGIAWVYLQQDLKPGGPNLLNPVAYLDALKSGTQLPGSGVTTPASILTGGPLDFISKIPGISLIPGGSLGAIGAALVIVVALSVAGFLVYKELK